MKIIENNQVVSISGVRPNEYNPKPHYNDTEELKQEFQKIKTSLRIHGQIDPVLVRQVKENDGYEIINGYHRYVAMKELGFEKIEIKNLGVISKEDAITKALSTEDLKIPLDVIEVAKLLSELKKAEFDLSGLPYTEDEISQKIALLEFDWKDFSDVELIEDDANDIKRLEKGKKYYFSLKDEEIEILASVFSKSVGVYSLDGEKLMEMVKKYNIE